MYVSNKSDKCVSTGGTVTLYYTVEWSKDFVVVGEVAVRWSQDFDGVGEGQNILTVPHLPYGVECFFPAAKPQSTNTHYP